MFKEVANDKAQAFKSDENIAEKMESWKVALCAQKGTPKGKIHDELQIRCQTHPEHMTGHDADGARLLVKYQFKQSLPILDGHRDDL